MKTFMLLVSLLALSLLTSLVHAQDNATAYYDNQTAFGLSGPALSVKLVNQNPDPAIVGETVDLRLGVQNGGQTAVNNVAIEVVPSYPFSLVSGQDATQDIGTISSYQGQYNNNQQIVKYTILVDKDATPGTYNLKVNIHQASNGAIIQQNVPIDIKGQQSAEIIHIDKQVIVPGQPTPVTFTINNVGTSPLRDLTFSWEDANGVILPVGSDNTQYVKYIDVGSNANVQYQVVADTNANPGLYKLNLHLSYDDPVKGLQNITTVAGVYVGGGTDFEVAYSDSSTSGTSFSVANTGSNPAYSVSVIIPQQPGWHVSGSNTQIIGNLNKGDYTIATFNLNNGLNFTGRRQAQNGEQNESFMRNSTMVHVQVAYSDTTGQRQIVDKYVTVSMGGALSSTGGRFAQQSSSSNTNWYIIAIVLVVAGFFGYRWYIRKKEPRRK